MLINRQARPNLPAQAESTESSSLLSESVQRRLALASILLLGGVLRFWNLASLGLANHYYTAAIVGMLQSWHNFFFVSAEPGGSVSVDKPPVGFWLQALSSWVFGVNGFGVLLPEILAGLASVVLVYHLVRRTFGTVAGLLAALALAVTPIFVATNRNNTIDSTLIFVLLLATWAFLKATERGGLRYLLLGAALVGVGFNVKMLEAFLPLPALYGLYVLGGRGSLRRKVPNVLLSLVVLLGVSFSWVVAVDLTPASDRPFVGSSGDNSVMSLALGYNGVERLIGMGGRGGLLSGVLGGGQAANQRAGGQRSGGAPGGAQSFVPPAAIQGVTGAAGRRDGGQPGGNPPFVPPAGTQGLPGAGGQRGGGASAQPGGFQGFGGGVGGGIGGIGRAGALRLFTAPLSKEVSWLLPFGLLSLTLLGVGSRVRWPLGDKHRAMVLWGGWLVTGGVFFSVAGFFHEYYLSMIAAPLAALFGIGAVEIWRLGERRRWWRIAAAALAAGATAWLQVATGRAFAGNAWWLWASVALVPVGLLISIASPRLARRAASAGFACVVAGLLIVPTIWSGLTILNPTENQSLPSAYAGRPSQLGSLATPRVDQKLLDFLQANTQGMKYLMAVPSSMQGSDYILATGRPVLLLGGFMGQDNVKSADDLKAMVAAGEIRYFYWNSSNRGGGGFGGGQSDVSNYLTGTCKVVSGFDALTQNSGAPGGLTTDSANGSSARAGGAGMGAMQVSLYDCGGGTR